jgi:hypothetical protein
MTRMQTMVRTEIVVNGSRFDLAQDQDIENVKSRVEAAAASPSARFVEFTVVGNRSVSVLISSAASVVLSVETVQYDPRDSGDLTEPYGGLFDF